MGETNKHKLQRAEKELAETQEKARILEEALAAKEKALAETVETVEPEVKEKLEKRRNRVPLGVPRLRLQVEPRRGYKRRWVNDKGDRVNQAKEGGYTLVARDDAEFTEEDVANRNDSLNDAVCKTVNSDGTKAYLMEIPEEWFREDQRSKAEAIDRTEDGLKRGEDTHGRAGADGRYVPKEGIKIS